MKTIVRSVEATRKLASKLAGELSGGEVLALEGELGAGKTEFVRGLAEALKSEDPVRSPSFTLLNLYRTKHSKIKNIVHVDLYRLLDQVVNSDLAAEIGLDEWLGRDDSVVVVEWPTEKILKPFEKAKRIRFEFGESETERIIEM